MRKNTWSLIYWISIFVMGVLGVIWAVNSIAANNGGGFLPGALKLALSIVDMICLFLLVFSRIKGKGDKG